MTRSAEARSKGWILKGEVMNDRVTRVYRHDYCAVIV